MNEQLKPFLREANLPPAGCKENFDLESMIQNNNKKHK